MSGRNLKRESSFFSFIDHPGYIRVPITYFYNLNIRTTSASNLFTARSPTMTVCNLKEDVQRPVKVIQTLYGAKSADSSDDFGVGKHFEQLIASGATVSLN